MERARVSGWAGLPVPCTNLNDALLRSVRLLFQSCGNTKGPWKEREIVWAVLVQLSGMRERGFFSSPPLPGCGSRHMRTTNMSKFY